jgi:GntR family transcriptional regulator/MocR family aminotransferase
MFEFDLTLPERGSRNLIRSLHQQLKTAILSGRLAAGHRLPSARRLAEQFGLSRNSATTVYELLQAEGLVEARHGAGYFVVELLPAEALAARRRRGGAGGPPAAFRHLGAVTEPPPFPPAPLPYDFQLGVPETPQGRFLETWRSLSARALRSLTGGRLHHGLAEGEEDLRDAIAAYVSAARAVVCRADDILVTNGAQQAFDLIARALVTPGETVVAVETPGYLPMIRLFRQAGARIAPVPVDAEGLRVDLLPPEARIVCVTPAHQFPLGGILPMERRQALMRFAYQRGAVVVEDDYDGEFRFDRRPLDALQMLDEARSVFFVGTFSKTLFPGLRLGYVIAPGWARNGLIRLKRDSDWHCALPAQQTLAAFIREGHLGRHVRRMRDLYAGRRALIEERLRGPLSPWLELVPGSAGLHVGALLRQAGHDLALSADLRKVGLRCEALSAYASVPGAAPGLAFGYGAIGVERIAAGLDVLEKHLAATR